MSIKSITQFIKKHILVASIGALLVGGGLVAIGSQVFYRSDNTMIATTDIKITEEEAKKIISDYTGISDLTYEKLKLERDDDYTNPHYDVDTYKDGVEYDFEIDAMTGDILSYSTDNKGKTKSKTETSSADTSSSTNQTQGEVISQDKVKEIVSKETGKDDLTYAYITLETDEGRHIYDVKATSGNTKYDVDIDAKTGEVVSSKESSIFKDRTSSNSNTASAKLSEEDVKVIVVKTTGQNNLIYTEIELSYEDDYDEKLVYEVTAYASGVEYELDIDANSGQVLSSSADREDD